LQGKTLQFFDTATGVCIYQYEIVPKRGANKVPYVIDARAFMSDGAVQFHILLDDGSSRIIDPEAQRCISTRIPDAPEIATRYHGMIDARYPQAAILYSGYRITMGKLISADHQVANDFDGVFVTDDELLWIDRAEHGIIVRICSSATNELIGQHTLTFADGFADWVAWSIDLLPGTPKLLICCNDQNYHTTGYAVHDYHTGETTYFPLQEAGTDGASVLQGYQYTSWIIGSSAVKYTLAYPEGEYFFGYRTDLIPVYYLGG